MVRLTGNVEAGLRMRGRDATKMRGSGGFRLALGLLGLAMAGAVTACGEAEDPTEPGAPGDPQILEVIPSRALAGQTVTLAGRNFGSDPRRVTVTFNGAPAELVTATPTSLVVLVPAELPPGPVVIEVAVAGLPNPARAALTVVLPGPPFASISAGSSFTCGILRAGGATCWGSGTRGQLGNGTLLDSSIPGPVSGGESFVTVSTGIFHACSIAAGGAAYCWGRNGAGQLGTGSTSSTLAPMPVAGALTFESLSAGNFHTCGISPGGGAYCWGANEAGQLGNGTTAASLVPALVAGGLSFTSLSAGGFHTCGVTAVDGTYCWGENGHGELGNGSLAKSYLPVRVGGDVTFSLVSAGKAPPVSLEDVGEHTCAVTPAGQAYCWGFNLDGQLGTGSPAGSLVPAPVASSQAFKSIAAGAFHTCGVTSGGTALCWGANDAGQLGGGTASPSARAPTLVLGGVRFASVSAGGASKSVLRAVRSHTCALTAEGIAFCWGRNGAGQLGSGTTSAQSTPVPVSGGQ
jgi:alpha-tubulin suppressor-like RCC1 family protein